ncbi:MAG: HEPN domain-containing protein [Planctomycetota bacterium]
MKPVTREWVAKAEADFQSAARELRRRNDPNLDIACFLAQQSIEKYLKARLQEESVVFGKTHDLEALASQIGNTEPGLLLLKPALKRLSVYAVVFRYPGRSATRAEAKEALAFAKQVREIVRPALGLRLANNRRRARPKSTFDRRRKGR